MWVCDVEEVHLSFGLIYHWISSRSVITCFFWILRGRYHINHCHFHDFTGQVGDRIIVNPLSNKGMGRRGGRLWYCARKIFLKSFVSLDSFHGAKPLHQPLGHALYTRHLLLCCRSVEETTSFMLLHINCSWSIGKGLKAFRKLAFFSPFISYR